MSASITPILDYASPQAKSVFRVGTRSVLRILHSDEQLRVIESLEQHAQAIGAIIFAWLSLSPMIAVGCVEMAHWKELPLGVGLIWLLPLAGLATTYGVIESTWGRTVLIVRRERIVLEFWSPLRRQRKHEWPTESLENLFVIQRHYVANNETHAELQLTFQRGPMARLFIGHPAAELNDIARSIRQIMSAT